MTYSYCPHCGTGIEKDSRFCHNCGANIEIRKEVPRESETLYSEAYQESSAPFEQEYQAPVHEPRKSKSRVRFVWLAIGVVMIAALATIIPLSLLSTFGPFTYTYLGSTSYTYEPVSILDVSLSIDNGAGDVYINFDDSLSVLFEATIRVYGFKEASINDAITFEDQISNGKVIITFDSITSYEHWSEKALKYDLEIFINPNAKVDFDLETYSGNISLESCSVFSATITALNLHALSGDISVDLGYETTITAPSINIKTSSGNIYVESYTDAVITSPSLTVEALSGDIDIYFGGYTVINSPLMAFKTSSGNIDVQFGIDTIINSTSLIAEAASGDIYIDFSIDNVIYYSDVRVGTSSGNIDLYFEKALFQNDIDWDIDALSGDITLIIEQSTVL
ncbi:MAG: zinc-ribbon domain-containing protein, partial [Promethearchaeota archaeon]